MRGKIVSLGDRNLLQSVLLPLAAGFLADFLDRGQKQSNQNRDNRDHHQQLDQGEPARRIASAAMNWQRHNILPEQRNRRIRFVIQCENSVESFADSEGLVKELRTAQRIIEAVIVSLVTVCA